MGLPNLLSYSSQSHKLSDPHFPPFGNEELDIICLKCFAFVPHVVDT